MTVYWMRQREDEVPADNGWLGDRETEVLSHLKTPARQASWRLGRWTLKQLVAAAPVALQRGAPDARASPLLPVALDHAPRHPQQWRLPPIDLRRLEILAADDGAPELHVSGKLLRVALSVTHREGLAVAALDTSLRALGCDLEFIEPRSDVFVKHFFTDEEEAALASLEIEKKTEATVVVWSAKESALKALRCGLRRDTRTVVVRALGSFSGARVDPYAGERHGPHLHGGWLDPYAGERHGPHLHGGWLDPDAGDKHGPGLDEGCFEGLSRGQEIAGPARHSAPTLADVVDWQPLRVEDRARGTVFGGWWCRLDRHVLTVIGEPQPQEPPCECRPGVTSTREVPDRV